MYGRSGTLLLRISDDIDHPLSCSRMSTHWKGPEVQTVARMAIRMRYCLRHVAVSTMRIRKVSMET